MEKAFVMIKPDGIKKELIGEIIKRILKKRLIITKIKKIRMAPNQFKKLYPHVYTKYPKILKALYSFLTKNDVIVMIVEGKNAIREVRKIRGPSNPAEAPKGTIRGDFAKDQDMRKLYKKGKITLNILHSADDKKQAKYEINIFFKGEKIWNQTSFIQNQHGFTYREIL